jgi:outer membrane protein, heavy metal efflux system
MLAGLCLTPSVCSGEHRAAGSQEGNPLRLSDAITLALEHSPALAAFPATRRAADARRQLADQRPPPTVSFEAEDALGSGGYRGVDQAQFTLTLSQAFELGGRRAARSQVAQAGRTRVDVDYELARAEVAAAVAAQFIHVVGDQQELAWSREAVRLAEATLATVQQRVRAAAASPLDEKRARIALARARIVEEHHEHELETARRRLAALWGATEAKFGEAAANLFVRPAVPDYDELIARIGSSPELRRWAGEKTVREAEIRLAESRRRPDVTAGLGVRQFAATDDVGVVAQISMPLGARSRAAAGVAEAQAWRDTADAGERETELRLRTALFGIAQELRHARTELDALESEILPDAEAALQIAREGFAQARYSQLELLDAQRTLLELRLERLNAAVAFHKYIVQLEKILGEPVTTVTAAAQP